MNFDKYMTRSGIPTVRFYPTCLGDLKQLRDKIEDIGIKCLIKLNYSEWNDYIPVLLVRISTPIRMLDFKDVEMLYDELYSKDIQIELCGKDDLRIEYSNHILDYKTHLKTMREHQFSNIGEVFKYARAATESTLYPKGQNPKNTFTQVMESFNNERTGTWWISRYDITRSFISFLDFFDTSLYYTLLMEEFCTNNELNGNSHWRRRGDLCSVRYLEHGLLFNYDGVIKNNGYHQLCYNNLYNGIYRIVKAVDNKVPLTVNVRLKRSLPELIRGVPILGATHIESHSYSDDLFLIISTEEQLDALRHIQDSLSSKVRETRILFDKSMDRTYKICLLKSRAGSYADIKIGKI